MEHIFYIVTGFAIVETIVISIFIICNKRTDIKLRNALIEMKKLRQLLRVYTIQHEKAFKDKLLITERTNLKMNNQTEINRFCTYNGNINQLYLDMLELYFPFISYIEDEYPILKRNDILMITLVRLGYDNQQISAIFNYTKRTIYKRRQIISKAMDISSLQLDDYIRNIAVEKTELMRMSS